MEEMSTDSKASVVRTLQIIVLALAVGVFVFALVALFLPGGGLKPWNAQAIVSLTMAGLSITMVLARIVVVAVLVQSGRQKIARRTWQSPVRESGESVLPNTDEGQLLTLFSNQTIFGSALLEGAAFCNLVAFLQEGQSYSLILGLFLLAGILAGVPTCAAGQLAGPTTASDPRDPRPGRPALGPANQ